MAWISKNLATVIHWLASAALVITIIRYRSGR